VICPTCERVGAPMTKHHLKTRRKDKGDVEKVCRECQKTIHTLFTQAELRDPRLGLDTIEGLLANERFAKAVAFIKTVPPGAFMKTRESRQRRGRRRR